MGAEKKVKIGETSFIRNAERPSVVDMYEKGRLILSISHMLDLGELIWSVLPPESLEVKRTEASEENRKLFAIRNRIFSIHRKVFYNAKRPCIYWLE